jgi:acylphosphatase
METKLLYKIYVTGDVQGVGFRWRTMNEARDRGITGFVQNMADGSVYIEAEGERDLLDYFVVWCKNGPGYVDEVRTEVFSPVGYQGFSIRH